MIQNVKELKKGSVYGKLFTGRLGRSKLAADLVFHGLLSQQAPCWAQPHWEDSCSHSPIRKGSLPPKGQNQEDIVSICIYFVGCGSQQNCACGLPFTTGVFSVFSCKNISRADVHCVLVPKARTCLQSCERAGGKYQTPGKPPREGGPRFNWICCLKGGSESPVSPTPPTLPPPSLWKSVAFGYKEAWV